METSAILLALCEGKPTGHQWIPINKGVSNAELKFLCVVCQYTMLNK